MHSLADLTALLASGAVVVVAVYVVRASAQRTRDHHRHMYKLGFPRTLTERQTAAFLVSLAGLATPKLTLLGRDSAVLEVIAADGRVEHFLRLPSASRRYFLAQLRAAVPGVEIVEVEKAQLPRHTLAQELKRVAPDKPLAIPNPMATAATVLAATSGAGRGQASAWQWVILGGSPSATSSPAISRTASGDARMLATLRVAVAGGRERAPERLARLRRAAASVSVPGGRLVPRLQPNWLARRLASAGTTPVITGSAPVSVSELAALVGWPIGAPSIPGLKLGRSPQLVPAHDVPRRGRVLGDSTTEPVRPVALSAKASRMHALLTGPTGSGKSSLAAALALQDIGAGRGVTIIDPKGSLARMVAQRLDEAAIDRVIWLDPTDEERPVPLPLLSKDSSGYAESAADTMISLLRHRFRDLGPRSSDILTSSLYSLASMRSATVLDLLRLWSDAGYRRTVVGRVAEDPALASFWAWFESTSPAERAYVLAAPTNKIRPLLQRSAVRNIIAAPRSTFSFPEALSKNSVVLVSLPEGVLGEEAAALIGQVVLARLWAAVRARGSSRPYLVTVDEAHRFLDQPTDLGDVLALSREYGVGYQLLTQSVSQFPEKLRDIAMNSARSKVTFQTSARDASRLAAEFGPLVTPDMIAGLGEYEAIGAVAIGGAVSDPFTFRTRPLDPPIPGRLDAVKRASRERYGLPREEIEASFATPEPAPAAPPPDGGLGPVGRRPRS